jgi:signal transduction histidine kinase
LVYNIITKTLGGRISASSVPGRGTTFTVQLPLIATPTNEP